MGRFFPILYVFQKDPAEAFKSYLLNVRNPLGLNASNTNYVVSQQEVSVVQATAGLGAGAVLLFPLFGLVLISDQAKSEQN